MVYERIPFVWYVPECSRGMFKSSSTAMYVTWCKHVCAHVNAYTLFVYARHGWIHWKTIILNMFDKKNNVNDRNDLEVDHWYPVSIHFPWLIFCSVVKQRHRHVSSQDIEVDGGVKVHTVDEAAKVADGPAIVRPQVFFSTACVWSRF